MKRTTPRYIPEPYDHVVDKVIWFMMHQPGVLSQVVGGNMIVWIHGGHVVGMCDWQACTVMVIQADGYFSLDQLPEDKFTAETIAHANSVISRLRQAINRSREQKMRTWHYDLSTQTV